VHLLLPLLQSQEPAIPPEEILLYLITFVGCVVFVITGWELFSSGWESYEEKYLEGATRTVDDLFLTIPPQHLLWLSVLCFFAIFALVFLVSESVLIGVIVGAFGFFVPRMALRMAKKKRDQKFLEQLSESLITLTNALRSGFSLPKAFQLIAHDMPKPICQEFGILIQELRLGIEVEEGLKNMLVRMPSDDLDLLVTSVGISNSVGGNLAEVFDKMANVIRERRRIEGRIDALTSQGRLQGLVVSIIPIGVAIAINFFDPKLFEVMYTTLPGVILCSAFVIMEILGFLTIRWIVTIEV
jgi:tight adherence protein B